MAPGSILHHISFSSTCQFPSPFHYFAIFYFPFHKPKIPNILLYRLSIYIRSHFANNREGIDNPFIALGASWCLFVQVFDGLCVVSYWIDILVLKSCGKYLLYFAASPFPLQGKNQRKLKKQQEEFLAPLRERFMPNQDSSPVNLPIFGAVAGEIYAKPRHTKYPSETLIPLITLFAMRLSFSSPPLLKRVSKTFAFSSPSICLHLCLVKIQ